MKFHNRLHTTLGMYIQMRSPKMVPLPFYEVKQGSFERVHIDKPLITYEVIAILWNKIEAQ